MSAAHKVHASSLLQRLQHQLTVTRSTVLHQRTLHCLIMRIAGNKYGFAAFRVDAGIIHRRRRTAGSRNEVLHLLRIVLDVTQKLCQLNGIVQRAARMAGNKVRHQILRQADFFIFLRKHAHKLQINFLAGLAHTRQNLRCDMLRCNLQQAADMITAQLVQKLLLFIRQQIIITDTAADKHLLDTR